MIGWRVLVGLGAGLPCLAAQLPPVPEPAPRPAVTRLCQMESDRFPLTVYGPDVSENRRWLEQGEDVLRTVGQMLQWKPDPRTVFVLRYVKADAPVPPSHGEFFSEVRLPRGKKEFLIEVHGTLPVIREPLVRSMAVAAVQAAAWEGAVPAPGGEIPRPPFWLTEGAVQRVLAGHRGEWADLARRLQRTGKLPPLEAVQGWTTLEELPTAAWIQQSVAFILARSATATPAEARVLRLWLQGARSQPGARYWDRGPESEAWWREVASARGPVDLPLLSWDQTAGALREALHFSARLKGESEARLASIMDLPEDPAVLENPAALVSVRDQLVRLRASSHWLWAFVIVKYEGALASWQGGRMDDYRRLLAEALILQQRMDAVLVRSNDLLDWVTVNYAIDAGADEWEEFRALVREVEDRERWRNEAVGDRRDLNPRQPEPQSGALPTELRPPMEGK